MTSNSPENTPNPLFPFFTAQPIKDLLKAIESSPNKTLLIAICGGSCSGKTSLGNYLAALNIGKVLPMDAYYKPISAIQEYADGIPAFDAPEAFALQRLTQDLNSVRNGKHIELPVYL
ncbi:MAG: hypothetical protein D3924_19300, partial [Candidatus Electrothrix sp. AR4]|nr:hypothetical protein [Candidatus Electrothrix sp. AR4]